MLRLVWLNLFFLAVTVLGQNLTPAQREDAEAERLKILRTSDQVEALHNNFEQLRSQNETYRTQLATLRDETDRLREEIKALKVVLEKMEQARVSERKVLVDEISKMIAAATKPVPVKETKSKATESKEEASSDQKGYYHVVEKGQSLYSIVEAFREQGVKVTIDEVRKTNGIKPNQPLQVGQKLFIPKK